MDKLISFLILASVMLFALLNFFIPMITNLLDTINPGGSSDLSKYVAEVVVKANEFKDSVVAHMDTATADKEKEVKEEPAEIVKEEEPKEEPVDKVKLYAGPTFSNTDLYSTSKK